MIHWIFPSIWVSHKGSRTQFSLTVQPNTVSSTISPPFFQSSNTAKMIYYILCSLLLHKSYEQFHTERAELLELKVHPKNCCMTSTSFFFLLSRTCGNGAISYGVVVIGGKRLIWILFMKIQLIKLHESLEGKLYKIGTYGWIKWEDLMQKSGLTTGRYHCLFVWRAEFYYL